MNDKLIELAAAQLRKPSGEHAEFIAGKMNDGNKELYKNTFSELELNDNSSVLEIGMGNGYFVNDILRLANNIKYHGCDYSKEMVEQSIKFNKELTESGNVRFHLASADCLPFPANCFDTIFSVNTIYFWEDKPIILNELSRALKPDGKLYLSLRPEKSMQTYPFVKYGFELFSKEKVHDLLSQNNFNVLSIIEKDESSQMVGDLEIKVESLIIIAGK